MSNRVLLAKPAQLQHVKAEAKNEGPCRHSLLAPW